MRLCLLLLILSLTANAQIREYDEEFLIDRWGKGLHLLFGGGVQSSTYRSDHRNAHLGWGMTFHTDVDWYFNADWAVEIGSAVNFNKHESNLFWNTLLTLGFRHRLHKNYLRAMIGSGVLVIVPDNNATRNQLDGPVIGAGFGKFESTYQGTIWYWEFTGTIQSMKQHDDIVMDGEVPVSIHSKPVKDNSKIYSLQMTLGVLLF